MVSSEQQMVADSAEFWHPERFTPRVGGRYDFAVRMLRVALPAIAIGVVVATAAYPLFKARETSFVLARDNIQASEDRLRMINPRYSGVDSNDRPFEVSAQSAVQPRGVSDTVTLTDIRAQMSMDDEASVQMTAGTGIYRTDEETLEMQGPVLLTTSSGYRIDAIDTAVDLDDHLVRSDKPVEAAGPLGIFRADGFEGRIDDDVLLFKGNVKSILQPGGKRLPVRAPVDDGVQAP